MLVLKILESSWISSVQSLSCIQFFVTPWTAARQASLSLTNSRSLLQLMSIKSVMPSNHLTLCHPLLFLPSIFPSIRIFSSESVLPIRWPKDWSFSFSISPSNEYSGLISFRIDWFDLLAVQGTLKSLLHGGLQSMGSQKVRHDWATTTLCSHQRSPIQEEDSGCPQVGTPSAEIVGSKALSSPCGFRNYLLLVTL